MEWDTALACIVDRCELFNACWISFKRGKHHPGMLVPASHPHPRHNLTSQVSQRPQHASVVTRSPLQPGFLARKVNSRTAQPMKVRRSMAEVLSASPQLASGRRSRALRITQWSFMLRQKREKWRASTDQKARSASAQAELQLGQPFLPSDTLFPILIQPERRWAGEQMRGHPLPEVETLSEKVCNTKRWHAGFPRRAVGFAWKG